MLDNEEYEKFMTGARICQDEHAGLTKNSLDHLNDNDKESAEEYLSKKNDRTFMLEVVKKNWRALRYASDDLKGDRDIVMEAVKQNGTALKHASDVLKGDPELIKTANQKGGKSRRRRRNNKSKKSRRNNKSKKSRRNKKKSNKRKSRRR